MRVLFLAGMLTLVGASTVLGEGNFEQWVSEFKVEAIGKGISSSLVDQAFEGVAPIPRVLELDRNQPESRMTFREYRIGKEASPLPSQVFFELRL